MLNDMQYGSSTSRYTPRYLSLKFHSLLISSMIICPFQSTWKWLQPYGVNGTQRKRVWEMSDIIQHFFLSLPLSHLCSNNDGICYHFFLPLSLPYQQIASFIWTFFLLCVLKLEILLFLNNFSKQFAVFYEIVLCRRIIIIREWMTIESSIDMNV